MSQFRSFSKDVIIYGVGNGLKKFIGLFLLPFYTRALTPSEFGTLDTLSTGVFLVTAFLGLGLETAGGYFFFKAKSIKEKRKILFTKFVLNLCAFLPILILIIFAPEISQLFFNSKENSLLVIITALIIPLNLLMSEQSHIFRYYRKPWRYNLITISKSLTNILFGISLVVVLKYGVLGAQFAALLSSFIVVVLAFFLFNRKVYIYYFSITWAKKMLKFGFPLIWAGMLVWVYQSSDRFFLLHYRTLTEIGYYSIGATFSQPLSLLNMAIQMSYGVFFYSTYHEETNLEKPKSKKLIKDVFKTYLALAIFISGFLSIFSVDIVKIIATESYLMGILAIPLLTFSNLFGQAFQITSVGISISEKTWIFTLIIAGTALLNAGLNFYFIPTLGFVGAAITTLLAYGFYWVISYMISSRFLSMPLPLGKIISIILASLIISLIVPFSTIYLKINFSFYVKLLLFIVLLSIPFLTNLLKINQILSYLKSIRIKI